MDTKVYKASVDLREADFKVLEQLAASRNVSTADILRDALANFIFIDKAKKNGHTLLIEDKNQNLEQVFFQ